jgi:hypothetical protein
MLVLRIYAFFEFIYNSKKRHICIVVYDNMPHSLAYYKEDIRSLASMCNGGMFLQDHGDRVIARLRAEMVSIFGEEVTNNAFAEGTALADAAPVNMLFNHYRME